MKPGAFDELRTWRNRVTTVWNWTCLPTGYSMSETAERRGSRGYMKRSKFHVRGRLALAFVLVLLTALAHLGVAQESGGAITGNVIDPSGAAVAGAAITAKDVDRGVVFKTESNTEGVYSLPRLQVGRYEVRVEKSGFQTAVRTAFDLVVNQVATIDVALTLG